MRSRMLIVLGLIKISFWVPLKGQLLFRKGNRTFGFQEKDSLFLRMIEQTQIL